MRWMAGKNSAAAPTFCMKLEITATVPDNNRMVRRRLSPVRRSRGRMPLMITPVWSRPRPMMMTAMIDTTAVLDSP